MRQNDPGLNPMPELVSIDPFALLDLLSLRTGQRAAAGRATKAKAREADGRPPHPSMMMLMIDRLLFPPFAVVSEPGAAANNNGTTALLVVVVACSSQLDWNWHLLRISAAVVSAAAVRQPPQKPIGVASTPWSAGPAIGQFLIIHQLPGSLFSAETKRRHSTETPYIVLMMMVDRCLLAPESEHVAQLLNQEAINPDGRSSVSQPSPSGSGH